MAPVLAPQALTILDLPADKKGMPPVLAVLFWAWLLVSVVVIVQRRATKRAAARTDEGQQHEPPADLDVTDVAEPDPDVAPFEAQVHASVGAGPTVPFLPTTPTPPPPVETATAPGPPPGFEAPVAPTLDGSAHRSAPAAGVADALMGIRMPCELVPLVFDRLSSGRITLSTTGHAAEEVGTALADEVERLGYVLRPLSDHEVLATRGGTGLRLTIRPPDADGRHFEHPTAREDSVVVEITLL